MNSSLPLLSLHKYLWVLDPKPRGGRLPRPVGRAGKQVHSRNAGVQCEVEAEMLLKQFTKLTVTF